MSIVGTRPPLISETNLYEPRHKARLAIKPGITGMWQVSGRSDITDFEEVVRLDKEYIENWDIGLDIKILLKVKKAREIQQIRYQNEPGINCNAQMSTALLQKYCVLDEKSRQLLKETSEKYGYSARVIHKLLRLARTSADLAEVENIRLEDVKRILNYRDLDRSNNKMLVVN